MDVEDQWGKHVDGESKVPENPGQGTFVGPLYTMSVVMQIITFYNLTTINQQSICWRR
jgi:hypothetical protein